MPDKEPTPCDRAPTSAPSVTPSPEPDAPGKLRRAKGATVWTVLGIVLGTALQYLLTSHGVPAPVADEAARVLQHAMPGAP
jgi:hypothetical protein